MFLKIFCYLGCMLMLMPAMFAEEGCFSMVVGKKASADGSVLFGHNEDNSTRMVAGMVKVERRQYKEGEEVRLSGGGRIPQPQETFAYWWLQMPECQYSDTLINEHGVAVASDNCPSREDNPALTDGGIGGPILRRLVIERARTAREGVRIAGELVEKFGYIASGRTLVICDPQEGWLMALVNGKHWLAARVPDDQVAIIANTYTIGAVDLADTANFMAAPDIVEYAVQRGWYNRADGPFNFEKAYADPKARVAEVNTHRQWSGLRLVATGAVPLPEEARLPFAVTPKTPMTVTSLAGVLRDHYEDSVYEPEGYDKKTAHKRHTGTICGPYTNSSSIFQLRSSASFARENVWWLSLWQPCSTPYMPFYVCLDRVPAELQFGQNTSETCTVCDMPPEFGPAYRTYSELAQWVNKNYAARIPLVRAAWRAEESAVFQWQKTLEQLAYLSEREFQEMMSRYCHGAVVRDMQVARELMAVADQDIPGIMERAAANRLEAEKAGRKQERPMNENDVRAFVYQWFSQFDRQADLGEFTRHLATTDLRIEFPEMTITDAEGFKAWYDGIKKAIRRNTHDVTTLKVSRLGEALFGVDLQVRWQAETYKNECYDNTYQQRWRVQSGPDGWRIHRYQVRQVGLVEVASSLRQWTGLTLSRDGRLFVNYPRWSDDVPFSVGEVLKDGTVKQYPNEEINRWNPEETACDRFVCVQSVVADNAGNLWVLDTANPKFQGIVPTGPQLVQIDLNTNQVVRRYPFDEKTRLPHSYLNDVCFDTARGIAYLSDSGRGALVVLDLKTGQARSVLTAHPSTKSEDIVLTVEGRPWFLNGTPPKVHSDGIALGPEGQYVYYQALTGRSLYRIATQWLRQENLSEAELGAKVEFVAQTGAADGLMGDRQGNIYLSALEHNAIRRLTPAHVLETVVADARISWPDSFTMAADGTVYFTTSQIHLGNAIRNPYRIFKIVTPEADESGK